MDDGPGCVTKDSYLDDAVVDGIQKRLDEILDPAEMRRRVTEMLAAGGTRAVSVPDLEARLQESRRRIDRLVSALAAGAEDLPSLRAALVGLERERAALERELETATHRHVSGDKAREELVSELLDKLSRVREVLAGGPAEERKAVVRTFLEGIRVDKARNPAVLRWYRVPHDAVSVKLVAVGGIEPPTRGL
jgi:hypothetical protein